MGILTSGRFRYCSSCNSLNFRNHAVECKYPRPRLRLTVSKASPLVLFFPFVSCLTAAFPLSVPFGAGEAASERLEAFSVAPDLASLAAV